MGGHENLSEGVKGMDIDLKGLVNLSEHDKEQIEEFKLFQKQWTEYVNATTPKPSNEQLFGIPYK
jgi:streptogramin lyase